MLNTPPATERILFVLSLVLRAVFRCLSAILRLSGGNPHVIEVVNIFT